MALVIPPGFLAWQLRLRHVTGTRTNTITGGSGNNSGSVDPVIVANLVYFALTAVGGIRSTIDSSVLMQGVSVQIGQDGGPPTIGESTTEAVFGARVMASVTPNVALLVKKKTSLGGRKHRGRWYIPWAVNESDADENGFILAADVQIAQTQMNNTLANLSGSGVALHILHNFVAGSPTPAPTQVNQLLVDPLVGTQRRRLGR